MKNLVAAGALAALLLVVVGPSVPRPAEAAKKKPVFNRTGPVGVARGQRLHITLYNGDLVQAPYGNVNIKLRNAVTGGVEGEVNWTTGILQWVQVDVLDTGDVEVNGEPIATNVPPGGRLELITETGIPGLATGRRPPIGTMQLIDLDTHRTLGIIAILIGL